MIDEFHVMYMYKKIQAEAATTDIKTLEQFLKKFRQVVAERREEYYREIGEKKHVSWEWKEHKDYLRKWHVIVFHQRISRNDYLSFIRTQT